MFVAAGDVNGDGRDDVITGAGAGGGPHVRVFSGDDGAELAGFFAYDAAFGGGVRVAAGDFDGDGRADILTGPGAGGGPHVRAFDGDNAGAGGQLLRLRRKLHRRRVRGRAERRRRPAAAGSRLPAAAAQRSASRSWT